MKKFHRTYLPDEVKYGGETYYCNGAISGAMAANNTPVNIVASTLKHQGRKAILVTVLSSKLRGHTDLHGKLYQPTKWIFTRNN